MNSHERELCKCNECGKRVWIPTVILPPGIQPGDLFDGHCPNCENGVYLEFMPLSKQEQTI